MKPIELFFALFCAAVAVVATTPETWTGALPVLKQAEGPTVPNSYIVDGIDRAAHAAEFSTLSTGGANVTHEYSIVNGYSGVFDDASLNRLLSDSSVEYIEPDYVASISYPISPFQPSTLPDPRRPRNSLLCGALNICPSTSGTDDGTGVDIYGVDTGIYIEHGDFGGRAVHGPAFGYNSSDDGNGHGTHTASTAAGTQHGIATGASLIGVKVLSDAGSGAYSDVMGGIDWVVQQAKTSGRPSVINCSLGGPQSEALNDAAKSAIDSGVHFVAAAGNSAADAGTQSPASEPSIVTVGAVDNNDQMAYFSNFGSVVDVFALGVDVLAAWIGDPHAVRYLSGTSMSSPAVAGTLAVELSKYGWAAPEGLQDSLKKNAQAVVTGQPEGTTNLLATRW